MAVNGFVNDPSCDISTAHQFRWQTRNCCGLVISPVCRTVYFVNDVRYSHVQTILPTHAARGRCVRPDAHHRTDQYRDIRLAVARRADAVRAGVAMTTATATKERPILFSSEMVKAILDGRKTQTRRVVKPQPVLSPNGAWWHWPRLAGIASWTADRRPSRHSFMSEAIFEKCPYGQPGDRLWVRETFVIQSNYEVEHDPPFNDGRPFRWYEDDERGECWEQCHYRATDPTPELAYPHVDEPTCRWKPSIFMPRWASRILLEIVDVRVERVQSISEADAVAEGIEPLFTSEQVATVVGLDVYRDKPMPWKNYLWHGHGIGDEGYSSATDARDSYRTLWDSINAKRGYGWDSNPWVWAVTFKRVEGSEA